MPILVKDFAWTQTSKAIHIKVPLNPVNHEKVDLFTTDSYIKAHFRPFLFEIFLLHDVDNNKSNCIVKEDLIVFDLIKKEQDEEWECLEKDLSKAEKIKIKELILEKCQEQSKQDAENRQIKKSELDRFTVRQAMSIDEEQHQLMDSRRNAERKIAMDGLEEWRVKTENDAASTTSNIKSKSNTGIKVIELPVEDAKENLTNKTKEKERLNNVKKQLPAKIPVKSEYVEKKKKEAATKVLPKLRELGQLEIKHTPRTFPTPSRESMAAEEEAWLKNVTLARRATGFLSEDLRPEEQDPQWCKEKGDEFFRSGNFLGAISAYTHGITLSDKLPSLFSNRAAAHFALGNFNKCVNDCSSALDLLKPPCEGNRRSRAKCIARRGAALVRVGHLSKGIDEMKAASKLLPDDEGIKKDIYDLERAWEQNPDSD